MYDILRPYLIVVNLAYFAWFIILQFYRFKPTGRACSGDYLLPVNKTEGHIDQGEIDYPENYGTVYLAE